ncbi:MAG: M48 family metallopeptidase [Sphingomonadales bacterium]|nr:M48 family metallopeptidase [Sphingomonadales bacterium]
MKALAGLDWLRRRATEPPTVAVAGRELPVAIRHLRHARRITLRLAPDGSEARVSMPPWGRTGDALAFVRARSDWLAEQLARVPQAAPLGPGATVPYRGQSLTITWAKQHPRTPREAGGELRLGGPAESLAPRLRRWLEGEARRLIAADLAEYAAAAGLPMPPLALSNARRRWGSCSASGQIRINWRLVMAPDFVRRSVVAHEVAHLLHFDHSPAFHRALAGLFEGDLHAANLWLRQQGRGLHALLA